MLSRTLYKVSVDVHACRLFYISFEGDQLTRCSRPLPLSRPDTGNRPLLAVVALSRNPLAACHVILRPFVVTFVKQSKRPTANDVRRTEASLLFPFLSLSFFFLRLFNFVTCGDSSYNGTDL